MKAQKKILTKFAECLGSSTRQKKLCREPGQRTRQRFPFAECQLEALGKKLTPSAPLTGGAWRACVLGTCSGFAECRPTSTRQRSHVAECLDLPRACIRQRPGMPCARFLQSVRGLALGKPHLHLLHTPGPQKNPSVSRPRAFHQAFGPCLERGGGCHPTSEPRGVFLAWSCRGATARPRPWTPRRASRSAASGSAYAASPTATDPAETRPAPWRRGRCWRSGGAREAPKRGAAGCGGRRWTRPPAAAAAAVAAAAMARALGGNRDGARRSWPAFALTPGWRL